MIKSSDYLKLLDCNNYLRNNIDIFIEGFVKFYGEKRRKEIEDKFRNTLIIAYQRPSEQELLISKAKEDKTKELTSKIMEENLTNLTYEDLFDNYTSYEYSDNMPINSYSLFLSIYNFKKDNDKDKYLNTIFIYSKKIIPTLSKEEFIEMVNKRNILEKYENIERDKLRSLIQLLDINNIDELYKKCSNKSLKLLKKINPSITLDNLDEYMNDENIIKLNYLSELYNISLNEYTPFSKDFLEYEEELKKQKKIERQIKDKYYYELIFENLDLIPDNKKEGLEEYRNNIEKNYYLSREIKEILGYSIENDSLLKAFSNESDEILLSKESSKWKVDSIKEDRIKFFNIWGINLGNNYESYLENEEVKRIWPTKERIEKYEDLKRRINNDCKNEIFINSSFYKKTIKEIEQRDLLNKDDSFDANLYSSSNNTFLSPNFTKDENGYKESSFIIINMDMYKDFYRDHFIVHELNHLLELSLSFATSNYYKTTCGWDIQSTIAEEERKTKVDIRNNNSSKRNYELFNEIINEIIAGEISKTMKDNNLGVFEDPKEAKYRFGTSYEHTRFLVEEFYNEFKDDIIKSRSNGNIDHILDIVGKDNFEELNNLFYIFFENYSGFKIYNALNDIRNNKQTENTKVYYELMDRKNEILERMRKNRLEKNINLSI